MMARTASKVDVSAAESSPNVPIKAPMLAIRDHINKELGDSGIELIQVAGKATALNIPRVPTGMLRVDVAWGGGFPVGRTVRLRGEYSSFKSTLATLVVAAFQRHCRVCLSHVRVCSCVGGPSPMRAAWMDVEGTFDIEWAKKLGVDPDLLMVARTETTQQASDVLQALLRSGECDILVLDSIAALVPFEELDKSADDSVMGINARLVNGMMRRIGAAQNKTGVADTRKPSVILINQHRMKIGVMFGSPETCPGGEGQKYVTSIDTRMGAPKIETKKNPVTGDVEPFKAEVPFAIKKNKTAPSGKSGSFTISLSGSDAGVVDDFDTVIHFASKLSLIEGPSTGRKGWAFGSITGPTKTSVLQQLQQNAEAYLQLRNTVMRVLMDPDSASPAAPTVTVPPTDSPETPAYKVEIEAGEVVVENATREVVTDGESAG